MSTSGDTMSTSGDTMSTSGDTMSTLGGYHEYIGGCSVHRRDTMNTSGGVQYIGSQRFLFRVTELRHGDTLPLYMTAAFHSVRQISLVALPPLRFPSYRLQLPNPRKIFAIYHPVLCVFSTSGDVQYIGGCSVHRGMFSTSGGVQYIRGIPGVHRGIP